MKPNKLTTITEASELIKQITKEELTKDLGKAALETLAIVLYQGPISRADIDYIRGVNSSFILRNLMIRGLIERMNNPNDPRGYLYRPTFELLSHLGITSVKELPEFDTVQENLTDFMRKNEEESHVSETN